AGAGASASSRAWSISSGARQVPREARARWSAIEPPGATLTRKNSVAACATHVNLAAYVDISGSQDRDRCILGISNKRYRHIRWNGYTSEVENSARWELH